MKKYVISTIIFIFVLVTSILIFSYKTHKNVDKTFTQVRVNEVTRSVFYTPQYIAISQGFFKKEKLNIQLTTGQGADKVMSALLSNQSDIGFAGPEAAIYVYNEGKEDYAQVFAQMTKKDGSFLVSKTKQENFNWKNLKNSTIIPGRKGGVPYMTLEYVLKKNGLNVKSDLVLDDSIKFDLMAGAFTGGNADYVTLFEPTASMTQNANKGYIVASVGEASGEIPYTTYFAKKSYIDQNSDTIKKFVKCIYEGQKWVKNHTAKDVANNILSFFPNTDVSLLETVVQRYKDIDVWNETPVLKEESFNLLQDVMSQAGELKQRVPYNALINNSFALDVIK
ncbi:MAG: ABC transporter substrate-binding protein [Clostridia bacterium]